MTCFSSIPNDMKIMATTVLVFIPVLLATTALASGLSFSADCPIRVDLVVLQHNVLVAIWFLTSTAYSVVSSMRNPNPDIARWMEQLRYVIRMPAIAFGTLTAILPLMMLILLILVSVKVPDASCYTNSGNFALVWFYADTCFFFLFMVGIVYAIVETYLRRKQSRANFHKSKAIQAELVKLHGTLDGWTLFCGDFADFFMNLQDSQKESLLPVLLLYAIDELTWELRELPGVLQSRTCLICEEGFKLRSQIVSCIHKPDLVHRDCLMRQIRDSKWESNVFLGKHFHTSAVSLVKLATEKFEAKAPDEFLQREKLKEMHFLPEESRGKKARRGVMGDNVEDFYCLLEVER